MVVLLSSFIEVLYSIAPRVAMLEVILAKYGTVLYTLSFLAEKYKPVSCIRLAHRVTQLS